MRIPACAVLTLAFAGSATAQDILRADQVLRLHFHVTPPFNRTPNTLALMFGIINVDQAFTTRRASLWNCDDLLGIHSDSLFGTHVGALSLSPSNTFTAAGSPYTFLNPAIVDMTSIQNGSILGIVDFRIATGQITYTNGLAAISLRLTQASGPSSGSLVSPAPVLDDVRITANLADPAPGTAGATNAFAVTGAGPGNFLFLGFGFTCGRFPLPCADGGFYDIVDPIGFLSGIADPAGNLTYAVPLPGFIAGQRILAQAIELDLAGGCLDSTNLVPHTY